jgi:hypothetical protein
MEIGNEAMMMRSKMSRAAGGAVLVVLALLGLTGSASAKLTGEFTKFQFCPWTNPEVNRCAYSLTKGGEVVLGNKKVPIVNPVALQGGYSEAAEGGAEAHFAKFFAATNGVTLAKVGQPVPGGLLGLVPPEESPPLVRELVELAAKNGLTGVNSTLELAKPASEIRISEEHLAEEIGVALKIPVKVHLENPFLGSSCYVGSSSSPIIWELTDGKTNPPAPIEPIRGSGGVTNFFEEGEIVELENAALVDNGWSAPSPSGCAGLLSVLVDPIIKAQLGSTEAGHNLAKLVADIYESPALAVQLDDEEHP